MPNGAEFDDTRFDGPGFDGPGFDGPEFDGAGFDGAGADRPRSGGSRRRRSAFGDTRANDRGADTGSGFGGFNADGSDADGSADEPARERGARGRRGDRRPGGRASAPGRGSGGAFGDESGDDARDKAPTDPASRARDICLRLLTGSARTRKQLADALRRKEIPDEIAEQVLDRLTEVGLIDDAAYARSWVEQRQRSRGLARRALAGELRAKGVDSALVAEAVAEVDPDDEEAAARRLVDRKLSSTRGLDRQVRLRRLAGMLARRGYPEGLALRVVRAALDAEGEDGADDDYLDSGED